MLNFFEASKKLMCRTVFKDMTIAQRVETAFIDSDFVPMLVQENYLSACPKKRMNKFEFHKVVKAAEAFAESDRYERIIMKTQDYSLMPCRMFMSTVYPC
jgi:replication factor C subunit 1